MKALIIGNDPFKQYIAKGLNIKERMKYFNPGDVYEDIYYVSHNPKLPTFIKEFALLLKCLRLIKKHQLDAIRAYNGFRAGFVGSLAKWVTKKPLIISLHDDYDALWKNLKLNIALTKFLQWCERRALESCDVCIVVSNYLKKYARLHGAKNVEVVFNKLNLKQYHSKPFTVVSVGRLNLVKNHETTIEAVQLARAQGYNVRLLIIGNGVLEKQIKKKLTYPDGLITSVPNTFLPMILHQCDLGVSASLNEGFGIGIAEFQACGLPIIASDIPGTKDIVDKKNALLFHPMDVAKLAQYIIAVKERKELREQLIDRSVECGDKFEWESLALKEKEIIERYKL